MAPAVSSNLITQRLVVATHNKGKWREFAELLAPYFSEIVSAADLDLPEPEETGGSFAENAVLKAEAACLLTGDVALADDSGLCVTALRGAPGIYSGRYAEKNGKRDFSYAMQRIHRELGDENDRSATFTCVLALVLPSGSPNSHELQRTTFEGHLAGTIIWPPRGNNGHGYDPFFVPAGYDQSVAEMRDHEKNTISHRALATQQLVRFLAKP